MMETAREWKFDLFVSYSLRERNDGPAGQVIADFLADVEARLAIDLGRPVRIFDPAQHLTEHLSSGVKIDETIRQALAASAAMIVMGSPDYWSSKATEEELSYFLHENDPERLLVVELFQVGKERYPSFLRELLPYRLWHDSESGPVSHARDSEAYEQLVVEVAHRILDLLGHLVIAGPGSELEGDGGDRPPGSPAVGGGAPDGGDGEPRRATDRYRTQTDDPARVDALDREPFAKVLAARILEARNAHECEKDSDQSFLVHIHGPWGTGKSSMLHLLQAKVHEGVPADKAPLVVWFNAWKHQRLRSPWWALLTALYAAASARQLQIGAEKYPNDARGRVRLRWWKWRIRADLLPAMFVALLLGAAAYALVAGSSRIETLLKILVPVIAAAGGVAAYARLMAFGSDKAAKTYADLSVDAFGPVVRLFCDLVELCGRPVIVFIDDLDRCDSEFVVELLEGIQTLFREAPVTYVVAADRKWICTSFDRKYSDFSGSIGDRGRPLGYLFLDKIFQISAGMPRLTDALQKRYLEALLSSETLATPLDPDLMANAQSKLRGMTDEAQIQRVVAAEADAPVPEQRAIRAAAALQITSAEALGQTEHRLAQFGSLIEPNPRSMKRLVNAIGMAQARAILEGRSIPPETRIRWTLLSLRWPVLADFIADNPDIINRWTAAGAGASLSEADPHWPEDIRQLFGNAAIARAIGKPGEPGALTAEAVTEIFA